VQAQGGSDGGDAWPEGGRRESCHVSNLTFCLN
jgi:hypothetical protein